MLLVDVQCEDNSFANAKAHETFLADVEDFSAVFENKGHFLCALKDIKGKDGKNYDEFVVIED